MQQFTSRAMTIDNMLIKYFELNLITGAGSLEVTLIVTPSTLGLLETHNLEVRMTALSAKVTIPQMSSSTASCLMALNWGTFKSKSPNNISSISR